MAEADTAGEEPARDQRRRVGDRGVLEAGDQLDPDPPRRHRVRQPTDPPSGPLVVRAVPHGEPGGAEPLRDGVERVVVDGFEADVHGVVGRTRLHDDALRLVVVAPRHGPRRPGLTGDETDDIGEERRQRRRVGHLDAHVGQLELVSHLDPFGQRPKMSAITASAWASTTSGACGSMPARRRHSGASTNIVGAAPVRM